MIKRFVDFDRESFEELKEFFLELIDEGCKFEEWIYYRGEKVISQLKFSEIIPIRLEIPIPESKSPEKKIQQMLNSYNLGILNLLPQEVDISYIDYKKFFNSEGLQLISNISNFKLAYIKRTSYWDARSKASVIMYMIFVR